MVRDIIILAVIGLFAGTFSGFLGIGGGLIMIPALVYFMGMSQHAAQGTTLAIMLPPITLLAVWQYHTKGHIDMKAALYVFMGFFIGSYFGGKLAIITNEFILKKVFAVVMIILATYMLIQKN